MLSQKRAQACRDYVISKGIEAAGSRPSATATSVQSIRTTPQKVDRRTVASKPWSSESQTFQRGTVGGLKAQKPAMHSIVPR